VAKKIVVIDDDRLFIRLTTDLLSGDEFEVKSASSGEEGLKLAEAEKPDLVIVDYMMPPGIDGMEVIRRLRAHPTLSAVPVVFCSSTRTGKSDVDKATAAGATDYIVKPYGAADFLQRIRQAVGGNKR
jgi:CheY-like chemotaxis protein